jgi:hypothetical protein
MARATYLAVGLFAVTISALPSASTKRQDESKSMVYDFADITPSRDLNWVDCFESFECTYLNVHLDYETPDVGTTNVAFIKCPSQNPEAKDVLFNPGIHTLGSLSLLTHMPI